MVTTVAKEVWIVTPSLSVYDAVSVDVLEEWRQLQGLGVRSKIYAEFIDDNLTATDLGGPRTTIDELMECVAKNPQAVLIYHHSILWIEGYEILKRAVCRIVLKYHNITPPEFFIKYDSLVAKATWRGIKQTEWIIANKTVWKAFSDSEFNAKDLLNVGLAPEKSVIVPPFHRVERDRVERDLNVSPEDTPSIVNYLKARNKINVLFVGRVVPNKGHRHLMAAMAAFRARFDTPIELHCVGGIFPNPAFIKSLHQELHRLGLFGSVHFWNKISAEDLATFYRHADVFLVLSEHEGFCVPILEAQYHRLPIIGADCAAIPSTMGADQWVVPVDDYPWIAASIYEIHRDKKVGHYLKETGIRNFKKYNLKELTKSFLGALEYPCE